MPGNERISYQRRLGVIAAVLMFIPAVWGRMASLNAVFAQRLVVNVGRELTGSSNSAYARRPRDAPSEMRVVKCNP